MITPSTSLNPVVTTDICPVEKDHKRSKVIEDLIVIITIVLIITSL